MTLCHYTATIICDLITELAIALYSENWLTISMRLPHLKTNFHENITCQLLETEGVFDEYYIRFKRAVLMWTCVSGTPKKC